MANDCCKYIEGKCSDMLYTREVPNEDFKEKVICKMCGTEFMRK